ncbi:hypothetical protein JXI42_10215 [bacterium]|nr:hypothetical protein [bacterium]
MNTKKLLVLFIVMLIGLIEAVPLKMNFQGRLTDDVGVPVDGSYEVVFQVLDSEEGGTLLWEETQTVDFYTGLFNALLGEVTPLPASEITGAILYFQMIVDDDTISPRTPLVTVPYSFRSLASDTAYWAVNTNFDTLNAYYDTTYDFMTTLDWDTLQAYSDTNHSHDFSDLTGEISDEQVGDDITVFFADSCGEVEWTNILNMPPGLDDGDDIDTFIAYWADIRDVPAGFDDGDDDIGFVRLRSNGASWLYDSVTFVAGSNITLNQNGDSITIALTSSPDSNWSRTGNYVYTFNNTDSVGIGTTTPGAKLDVNGDVNIEGDVDFNQNEAKNFRIENRTSDPASPLPGQMWIRTDL